MNTSYPFSIPYIPQPTYHSENNHEFQFDFEIPHSSSSSLVPYPSVDCKRRRISRACDNCWKRKIRCVSANEMSCYACYTAGFLCTYERDAKKRGPKTVLPLDPLAILEVSEEPIPATFTPKIASPSDDSLTQRALIDAFYEELYDLFPFIPKKILMMNLKNEPLIMIYAIYANAPNSSNSMEYYRKAMDIVVESLESPSLSKVIALRLLAHASFRLNKGTIYTPLFIKANTAVMLFSMAIQMGKQLELYIPINPQKRSLPHVAYQIEEEIRIRVWTECITCDCQLLSLRPDGSSVISSNQCNTGLPLPDACLFSPFSTVDSSATNRSVLDAITPETISNLRNMTYAGFKCVIFRILKKIHTMTSSEGDVDERSFLYMEACLKAWMSNLPEDLRQISPAEFDSSLPLTAMPWQKFSLHIYYSYAMVALWSPIVSRKIQEFGKLELIDDKTHFIVGKVVFGLQTVAHMLEILLSRNSEMRHISNCVLFCIYQMGRKNIEILNSSASMNVIIRHSAFLELHIDVLEKAGQIFNSLIADWSRFLIANKLVK